MTPEDFDEKQLEQQLSEFNFSADSQVRERLYRYLKQQSLRPSYRQPPYVTFMSRLGAVIVLATMFGVFWGMINRQEIFPSITVTALAAPHLSPDVTPAITVLYPEANIVHPKPLPTPLAEMNDQIRPVVQTGTINP